MSLREQLIERLEKLADQYASSKGAPTPDALRRLYADECIRQMEWARQECVAAWQPDYDACELDFSDPLTVAPDDWKP